MKTNHTFQNSSDWAKGQEKCCIAKGVSNEGSENSTELSALKVEGCCFYFLFV